MSFFDTADLERFSKLPTSLLIKESISSLSQTCQWKESGVNSNKIAFKNLIDSSFHRNGPEIFKSIREYAMRRLQPFFDAENCKNLNKQSFWVIESIMTLSTHSQWPRLMWDQVRGWEKKNTYFCFGSSDKSKWFKVIANAAASLSHFQHLRRHKFSPRSAWDENGSSSSNSSSLN